MKRGQIVASDYEVVLCLLVIDNDFKTGDLPFMARYELMRTHKYANRTLGYRFGITIKRVTVDDAI